MTTKREKISVDCFPLFFKEKNRMVLISVTLGIYPYRCCFMTILSNFNSILINFSALLQLYGTTTWHVHFMTRGGGGYALVLIAPLTFLLLINGIDVRFCHMIMIKPFRSILCYPLNIIQIFQVLFSHMKMNFSKMKHKNKFLPNFFTRKKNFYKNGKNHNIKSYFYK